MSEFWQYMIVWLFRNMWQVLLLLVVIHQRRVLWQKLFLEPITGGNGYTVMTELAQYVMVVLLIAMVVVEARTPDTTFSDGVFLSIAGAVAVIAGIKLNSNKKQDKKI